MIKVARYLIADVQRERSVTMYGETVYSINALEKCEKTKGNCEKERKL